MMRIPRLVAVAVAVAAATGAAKARAGKAGGPNAATAGDYLRVFNSGIPEAYAAFLRDRWPTGTVSVADLKGERDQTGGYDVVNIERGTDTQVVEVVKSRLADVYRRLTLAVEPSASHSITKLLLEDIPRPAGIAAPERVADQALVRAVDSQLAAMGDFSGAVLIARHGRAIYSHAAGLADREHGIANTLQTRFGTASMGKMFTAVSILQLAQAHRLDLDATVGTYLKDYPNAEFARSVTIRQLLMHTGGAGDFMSQMWADNIERLKTPSDYVAMFGDRPPGFPPGSRFSYANYGFVVLGRIVEVVSGQSYQDYLRDHVFLAHPAAPGPVAMGYMKGPQGYRQSPAPFRAAATPAGGIEMTVGDMFAFSKALTGHRLLDAANTRLLTTGKIRADESFYAYGFEDRSAGSVRDVGHDGGAPGANGGFHILNDGQAMVIVFSNVAPTWRADKLANYVAARVSLD